MNEEQREHEPTNPELDQNDPDNPDSEAFLREQELALEAFQELNSRKLIAEKKESLSEEKAREKREKEEKENAEREALSPGFLFHVTREQAKKRREERGY